MPELSEAIQVFTGMTGISVLSLLASIVLVADNRTVGREARVVFIVSMASIVLIEVADWVNVVLGPGNAGLRVFHVLSMAVTFSLAPMFPVAIARTVFPEHKVRWVTVLLGLQVLLEVATIFTGLVFWVDASNVYHRGTLYAAYMVTYSVSAVLLSYESIRAGRDYQSVSIASVLSILAFLVLGAGIQIANSKVRTSWPTVGMVLFLYFQFYAEMILRTDALTHLLNRHSYEEFLARPSLPCTVVLVDVDSFKQVNDSYGHGFGDECLQTIAGLMRQAFGSAGLCFRTGGDEFTIMVTKHAENTPAYMEELERLIRKAQGDDPRLPGVSMGVAQVAAGTDIHFAIREADERMYASKRLRKGGAVARREDA